MQGGVIVSFLSLVTLGMGVPMSAVKVPRPPAGDNPATGILCLLCIDVVEQAKEATKSPDLQKRVLRGFEEGVCALFPKTVGAQCETRVKLYAPLVFELVTHSLDAKAFCTDIALCLDGPNPPIPTPPAPAQKPQSVTAVPVLQSVVLLSSLSMSRGSGLRSGGSSLSDCEVCVFVVREAVQRLTSNTTEEKLLHVVDKLCQALPTGLQKPCWSFLQNGFLTMVIRMVVDDMVQPEQVCAALGFCPSKGARALPSLMKQEKQLKTSTV